MLSIIVSTPIASEGSNPIARLVFELLKPNDPAISSVNELTTSLPESSTLKVNRDARDLVEYAVPSSLLNVATNWLEPMSYVAEVSSSGLGSGTSPKVSSVTGLTLLKF